MIKILEQEVIRLEYLFRGIEEEMSQKDALREEIIRIFLKQILIRATRLWRVQHLGQIFTKGSVDLEFLRQFTRLLEVNFREEHNVADYADLMKIAAMALTISLNG